MTEPAVLTAADVVTHLRAWMPGWALIEQVPYRDRRIDVLIVSPDGYRVAIEVKVSGADYRHETDAKREASWLLAHLCYYAAPAGVIDPATIPEGWGLLTIDSDGEIASPVVATRHVTPVHDEKYLLGYLTLRLAQVETEIRTAGTPRGEVARLRRDAERLRGVADRAGQAAVREKERAQAARSELLSLEGAQECGYCHADVTWQRGGDSDRQWVHVSTDPTIARRCRVLRVEANKARRQAATGAEYLGGYPDPIVPVIFRRQAR